MRIQRTLMLIKPDGVGRGLIGNILTRCENKGYRFSAMKMVTPNKTILEKHYSEQKDKSYYHNIEKYMMMGPVMVCIVEGNESINVCRKILGSTKPEEAEIGTIRGDLAQHISSNICHASDSEESANNEINIWFNDCELIKLDLTKNNYSDSLLFKEDE